MTIEEILAPPDSESRYRLLVPVSEYISDEVIEELLMAVEAVARETFSC